MLLGAVAFASCNKFDLNDGEMARQAQEIKNNVESVRNSAYYTSNNHNYFETDGVNPVILIPIQAFTDDFKQNHLFYYYYKPEEIPAGMDEVEYIKQLPKYMAIQVERIQTSVEEKAGAYFHRQEFLLPFYKNNPVEGDNEASAIFPKGYKVGFLNLKTINIGTYDITNKIYGCTYGEGRLNYEINHYGDYIYPEEGKVYPSLFK